MTPISPTGVRRFVMNRPMTRTWSLRHPARNQERITPLAGALQAKAHVRPAHASMAFAHGRLNRQVVSSRRDPRDLVLSHNLAAGSRGMHAQLEPGTLVLVALADSAKAPRRLALVKGITHGGSYVLLHLSEEGRQTAVRRTSIKMLLPPPTDEAVWDPEGLVELEAQSGRLSDAVTPERLRELWEALGEEARGEGQPRAISLERIAASLFMAAGAREMFAALVAVGRAPELFQATNAGSVLAFPTPREMPAARKPAKESALASGAAGRVKQIETQVSEQRFAARARARLIAQLAREQPPAPALHGPTLAELEDLWGAAVLEWNPAEDQRFVAALENVAMGKAQAFSLGQHVQELLQHLLAVTGGSGMFGNQAATELLVRLGVWRRDENLHLKRSPRDLTMPPDATVEAARLLASPPADPNAAQRESMLSAALAIDDRRDATDVDDAVSIEVMADGTEWLHVHVADVSRWVAQGSLLDRVALDRAYSIYLPELVAPMLPVALATDALSLFEGAPRGALTFSAAVSEDGSLSDFRIAPTTLEHPRQLTYQQVDDYLDAADTSASAAAAVDVGGQAAALAKLHQISERRMAYRYARNAIDIQVPKSEVKLLPTRAPDGSPGPLELVVRPSLDGSSRSRLLVQECMLVAGEVAARFAADRKLPFIFRCQVPASKIPPLRIADPQAEHYSRNYQQVLLARPAVSMPVPSPHHGLGLDRYAQVTSPIRRYSDLVLHRIIKAALAAAPPAYSAEDLRLLMPHISQRFSSIQRLQRSSQRFWVLEHVRRQVVAAGGMGGGLRYAATVLRVNRSQNRATGTEVFAAWLLLNELGHIEAVRNLVFNPGVGSRVSVSVSNVNPHTGVLNLVLLPQ